MTSEFRLFTRVTVAKVKAVVANPDEPADPEGDGGFAEWAMLTLHTLRIELAKSYRVAVDLLSEMPGVLEEIGLSKMSSSSFESTSMAAYNQRRSPSTSTAVSSTATRDGWAVGGSG